MRCWQHSTISMRAALIALAGVLAGCEGTVSTELGTTAPADPAIDQILVEVDGVEFRKESGGIERLEFDSSQQLRLMSYLDGNDFRLFTDEQLPDARYTGVRLLFGNDDDEENAVTLIDGREYPLTVSATNEFSAVDFTVEKDDSSSDSIELTLDLRQSLPFDRSEQDGPTLTPVIRAIRAKDAGGISGNVAVNCPANSVLAIYAFSGEDITPDDSDGVPADPYLTTQVGSLNSSSSSAYAFRFLPEGSYTLAATCRGDEDNPTTNDDLNFSNEANVDVDAESTITRNIPN